MKTQTQSWDRRTFLKTTLFASGAVAFSGALGSDKPKAKIKLGLDNFAVRAMNWKGPELLDYAASLALDSVLISDLDAFGSLEDTNLKELKAKADGLGLQIHAGTWSICPTSRGFKNKWGTAEEHLALAIRVAKTVGSPVVRCVLGAIEDRKTEGGIEARMADTVKVCKACRSQAMDAGIKIAIENHAGDMQAWELVGLIEAAGKDYVGANFDSGNAAWTMEDPVRALEILGPYVVTTSLRDSMVWEYEQGAKVQWTAMGEGNVDLKGLFEKFRAVCPTVPVHIETISGFPRDIPFLKKEHWEVWPKARASDFAQFLALAKTGKPIPPHRSPDAQAEREYQKGELERSIKYCKATLGLGAR